MKARYSITVSFFVFLLFISSGDGVYAQTKKHKKIRKKIITWIKSSDNLLPEELARPWKHGKKALPILRSILKNPSQIKVYGQTIRQGKVPPSAEQKSRYVIGAMKIAKEMGGEAHSLKDVISNYFLRLTKNHQSVRRTTIRALAGIGAGDYKEAIASCLYNDAHYLSAAEALGKLGHSYRTITALKIWSRQNGLENIGKFERKSYKKAIKAIKQRIEGNQLQEKFYQDLLSEHEEVISETIPTISEKRDGAKYSILLVPLLFDEVEEIRMEALNALGKVGDHKSVLLALEIWKQHVKEKDQKRKTKWFNQELEEQYARAKRAIQERREKRENMKGNSGK